MFVISAMRENDLCHTYTTATAAGVESGVYCTVCILLCMYILYLAVLCPLTQTHCTLHMLCQKTTAAHLTV